MLDPQTILDYVQGVGRVAKTVCDAIDGARGFGPQQQGVMKLREAVGSIKADMIVYKVLITSMMKDTKPDGPFTFTVFINPCVCSAWLALYMHSQQTVCNITDRMEWMQ